MENRRQERWKRVEALLDDLLDRPPSEREDRLAAARGDDPEVAAEARRILLRGEAEDALVDGDVAARAPRIFRALDLGIADSGAPGAGRTGVDPWQGRRLGPYRLVEEIGRGGMGVVFRAIRDDRELEQEVAVKVAPGVLLDPEVATRFRAERQILASVRHPNVARLLDAGTTEEGIPYLVAELVEGEPVDAHCRRAALSIPERLRLLLQVCGAVDHLHRNLIVHRDLKPSNILVTPAGEVRLLDFGIAKLLEEPAGPDVTRLGRQPLSPDCASPEQLRGEPVTTASDVYALGVLLYRVLADEPPYRLQSVSWSELAAHLEAVRTRPPSRVAPPPRGRALRGDLDAIVLRALAADPADRYRSAAELGDDLERVLAGRPVAARLPTVGYRVRKFARRHPRALGAAAAVLLVVAAAAGFATAQARIARRERDQARVSALAAQRTAELLEGMFEAADPFGDRGRELSARELLLGAARRVEDDRGQDPAVRAALLTSLGRSLQNLGDAVRAEELHRQALALRIAEGGERDVSAAEARTDLGWALAGQHRSEEADAEVARAVAILRQAAPGSLALARALASLGAIRMRSADAEALFREALEIAESHDDRPPGMVPAMLADFATHHDVTGRREQGLLLLRRAIEAQREALGPVHPNLATMEANLAIGLYEQGAFAEADATYQRAIASLEAATSTDHPKMVPTLTSYGRLLLERGRFETAGPVIERAADLAAAILPESDFNRLAAEINLATLRAVENQPEEAADGYRRALERMRTAVGDDHPGTIRLRSLLGSVLVAAGATKEARSLLETALEAQRQAAVPPRQLGDTLLGLGRALRVDGELARAETLLREAVEIRSGLLPVGHWQTAEARLELAEVLAAAGRRGEAESCLRAAAPALANALGADDERTVRARDLLATTVAEPTEASS